MDLSSGISRRWRCGGESDSSRIHAVLRGRVGQNHPAIEKVSAALPWLGWIEKKHGMIQRTRSNHMWIQYSIYVSYIISFERFQFFQYSGHPNLEERRPEAKEGTPQSKPEEGGPKKPLGLLRRSFLNIEETRKLWDFLSPERINHNGGQSSTSAAVHLGQNWRLLAFGIGKKFVGS